MKVGYFYDKETNKYISNESIESQLPDIFLTNSMKNNKFPKTDYLTLLGKTCCVESIYIDRLLLDRIIENDLLYHKSIEFLCEKYNFYCFTIDN